MKLTQAEFQLLIDARREQRYDELELLSVQAVMMQSAYHAKKRLKPEHLFKRPTDEPMKVEDMREKQQRLEGLINKLNFSGKEAKHGN